MEHISAASYHEALAGKELSMINPTSRNLRLLVADLSQNSDIDVQPARGFLTSEDDFGTWVTTQGTKRLLMENFYRDGRRATGILMEEAPSGGLEPAGGAYNFDKENRNPPPKGVDTLGVPHAWSAVEDEIDREVRHYLDEWEASGDVAFIGSDGPRIFPATRAEALEALEAFVTQRLKTFGPTEDAAMSADWAMSHSLLSPDESWPVTPAGSYRPGGGGVHGRKGRYRQRGGLCSPSHGVARMGVAFVLAPGRRL